MNGLTLVYMVGSATLGAVFGIIFQFFADNNHFRRQNQEIDLMERECEDLKRLITEMCNIEILTPEQEKNLRTMQRKENKQYGKHL